MATDTVYMPSNSLLMIHNPMTMLNGAYGKDELEANAQALDKVKYSIINSYLSKVKISREALNNMMSKETWITANEAKRNGIC